MQACGGIVGLALMALLFTGCAEEGLPYLEAGSFEEAMTLAKGPNALIVVDFFADG